MAAGLPVVGLGGAGGTDDLIAEHGRLVDRDDLVGVAAALDEASREGDERARAARARLVAEQFRFDDYCFDLLRLLDPDLEKVSVVVPNYNYARYLDGRMRSIFEQTYPIFETIVLDDCSTDGSLARLDDIARTSGRRFRIVANDENSGSPFAQWERGCRLARGKYVWVAEADDGSDPRFLEEVVFATALRRSELRLLRLGADRRGRCQAGRELQGVLPRGRREPHGLELRARRKVVRRALPRRAQPRAQRERGRLGARQPFSTRSQFP